MMVRTRLLTPQASDHEDLIEASQSCQSCPGFWATDTGGLELMACSAAVAYGNSSGADRSWLRIRDEVEANPRHG